MKKLQMPFSNMMTQNAQKHVLVVGAVCHLEVDVAVFRTFGAGVFRPSKEDELAKRSRRETDLPCSFFKVAAVISNFLDCICHFKAAT